MKLNYPNLYKHIALVLAILTMPQFVEQLKLVFGENPFILPILTVSTILLSAATRYFNPNIKNSEIKLPIIAAISYVLTEILNNGAILSLTPQTMNVLSLAITLIFSVKNYLYKLEE